MHLADKTSNHIHTWHILWKQFVSNSFQTQFWAAFLSISVFLPFLFDTLWKPSVCLSHVSGFFFPSSWKLDKWHFWCRVSYIFYLSFSFSRCMSRANHFLFPYHLLSPPPFSLSLSLSFSLSLFTPVSLSLLKPTSLSLHSFFSCSAFLSCSSLPSLFWCVCVYVCICYWEVI